MTVDVVLIAGTGVFLAFLVIVEALTVIVNIPTISKRIQGWSDANRAFLPLIGLLIGWFAAHFFGGKNPSRWFVLAGLAAGFLVGALIR